MSQLIDFHLYYGMVEQNAKTIFQEVLFGNKKGRAE